MSSAALDLLLRLHGDGVRFRVQDGRLEYRPRRAVEADAELAAAVARHEADLVRVLGVRILLPDGSEAGVLGPIDDGGHPGAAPAPASDVSEPPERHDGPWPTESVPVTGDLLAARTLDDLAALRPSGEPRATCYACGETIWWRLRSGGPWVCGRCHDPAPPASQIEWWGEEAAS